MWIVATRTDSVIVRRNANYAGLLIFGRVGGAIRRGRGSSEGARERTQMGFLKFCEKIYQYAILKAKASLQSCCGWQCGLEASGESG